MTNVRATTSLRREPRFANQRPRTIGPTSPISAFARFVPDSGSNSRNSLLSKIISLLRFSSFPVLLLREFRRKCPSQKGFPQHEWAPSSPSSLFSLYFSLLPGNLKTEIGSIVTASATTQSRATGDLPNRRQRPAIGGLSFRRSASATAHFGLRRVLRRFVSAPKFPFPRKQRRVRQRRGSMWRQCDDHPPAPPDPGEDDFEVPLYTKMVCPSRAGWSAGSMGSTVSEGHRLAGASCTDKLTIW